MAKDDKGRNHSKDETRKLTRIFALDLDQLKIVIARHVKAWSIADASTNLNHYLSAILVMNGEIHGASFPSELPNLRDLRRMMARLIDPAYKQNSISLPHILMVLNSRTLTIGLMTDPSEDHGDPELWASKAARTRIRVPIEVAMDWLNTNGRIVLQIDDLRFRGEVVGQVVLERLKRLGFVSPVPEYTYAVYWTDDEKIPRYQEYDEIMDQNRYQELKFANFDIAENYVAELKIQAAHNQLKKE